MEGVATYGKNDLGAIWLSIRVCLLVYRLLPRTLVMEQILDVILPTVTSNPNAHAHGTESPVNASDISENWMASEYPGGDRSLPATQSSRLISRMRFLPGKPPFSRRHLWPISRAHELLPSPGGVLGRTIGLAANKAKREKLGWGTELRDCGSGGGDLQSNTELEETPNRAEELEEQHVRDNCMLCRNGRRTTMVVNKVGIKVGLYCCGVRMVCEVDLSATVHIERSFPSCFHRSPTER